MGFAEFHMVANKIPLIGIVIAALLLSFSLARHNSLLLNFSMVVITLATLTAIPVVVSGLLARPDIQAVTGMSKGLIVRHQAVASLVLIACSLLGVAAVGGMLFLKYAKRIPRGYPTLVVVMVTLLIVLLGWTSHRGKSVRKAEIEARRHSVEQVPANRTGGLLARQPSSHTP